MESANLIIMDGHEFTFTPGETLLDVARRNALEIPTLCHMKGASPTGACRICVVEVEGARTLLASCVTPATPKMVVRTESPKVVKARKLNLELLLSSGHHNCLAQDLDADSWTDFQLKSMEMKEHEDLCPAYGDCCLQDLAIRYQVKMNRFSPSQPRYPIENVNPFIVRDLSRCVLCGRCVQACNEIQVNHAISYGYRGAASKIVAKGDRPLKDSDCVFCGECVQACPVGALVAMRDFGARDVSKGETKRVRTTCGYCGVGCQLYLHVREGRVVRVTGVEDVGPNHGSLCVKGRFGFDFIHDAARLKSPLIRENGRFREASWEEALGLVAERLGKVRKESGADSIGFLASARITNEDNYLAQKFARVVLGTNSVDHCACLSHSSTVAGLAAAFGIGAMTNPIGDIEKARVILITGSNTTENHPVLSTYVKRAVSFRGAKLIVVDPRRIDIARFATTWLRPKPGTDVAWINGMMHVILREGLHREEYVKGRTVGFDEMKRALERYTPELVEGITGIPKDHLIAAARLYAEAPAASILYDTGITRHVSGADNVKSLANLAMLCCQVGVEGGGVNPLWGRNNEQGACDMGGLPGVFTGDQKVTDPAVREKMAKAWGVASLPEKPGLTAAEMIVSADQGILKAMYIVAEDPMVSDPDLNQVRKSLGKLDFLVVQDIFLTETAQMARVVLPSASFAEKEGTFTNTERRVQRVRKAVEPPGQAREDWRILCDLAGRMGHPMNYDSSEAIMKEISEVTPSYRGIRYERLQREGIHWPCTGTDHPGTPCLHVDQFACGRGVFHAVEYSPGAEVPDRDFPLYLTLGRVLYPYHAGTMTMKSEDLNRLATECFVEMSRGDADSLQIQEGDAVRVVSRRGEIKAKAHVSLGAVEGTLFIPFHYAEAAVNVLTRTSLDPTAEIPELKVSAVRIQKV